MKLHHYTTQLQWTGNKGEGTKNYSAYDRDHVIAVQNKPALNASSDPQFRGDPAKYNPEELLVAALSSCHMLWFLHICANAGVIVTAYEDNATGKMQEDADGGGRFIEVLLKPVVWVKDAHDPEKINRLHAEAHRKCFIANSCNFPVKHQAVCYTAAK